MNTIVLKIARIGNSRGIRIPAAMLRKYHMTDSVIAEEKANEISLRPRRSRQKKLSWAETAKSMAAARENWADWDVTASDGLHGF